MVMLLLKENPTTKLKNELLFLSKKTFLKQTKQTQHKKTLKFKKQPPKLDQQFAFKNVKK